MESAKQLKYLILGANDAAQAEVIPPHNIAREGEVEVSETALERARPWNSTISKRYPGGRSTTISRLVGAIYGVAPKDPNLLVMPCSFAFYGNKLVIAADDATSCWTLCLLSKDSRVRNYATLHGWPVATVKATGYSISIFPVEYMDAQDMPCNGMTKAAIRETLIRDFS